MPPLIESPRAVYDARRGRMLVIAGGPDPGTVAVHALELAGEPRWSVLATRGTAPAIVSYAGLVYDPIRDRLLIFGGGDFGDVWALDLSDPPTWQLLPSSGTHPSWRLASAAVYDSSHDRVIVFGGFRLDSQGSPIYFNDTYSFSLTTNQWSPLATEGTPPAGRYCAAAVYDPRGDRMVLFGGQGQGSQLLGDAWTLGLDEPLTWAPVVSTGLAPTPRAEMAAVYDPVRQGMVIWSGISTEGYAQDLWTLSLAGPATWTSAPTIDLLDRRMGSAAVYDPVGDRLVTYGGGNNLGWLDQCASIPLANPRQWTEFLPSSPPDAPSLRASTALAVDARRNQVVALGGYFRASDLGAWIFSADDRAAWTPFTPSYMTRLPFTGPAMYDSVADRALILTYGSIWALSLGSEPIWRSLIGVPSAWDPSLMLDPLRRRLILYGGAGYIPEGTSFTLNDVWAFDLDGGAEWSHLGVGPVSQGSAGQSAFYDPARDRMIVMGGYWMYGVGRHVPWGNAMWATPLSGPLAWTALTTTGPQPPDGQTVLDTNRDRFLRFSNGGVRAVWTRTARDTGEWVQLDPAGVGPPGDAAVVFDAARDQVLALFAPAGDGAFVETWALSFGPPEIFLRTATARFNAVELEWYSDNSRGRPATIERRGPAGEWTTIAHVAFDETGTAFARDREVASGARYAYRLSVLDGTGTWSTDSVWVEVPPWPVLALLGARPNPTATTFHVEFSLPDAAPARLDVFDVGGRRICTREVGPLGPGTHTVPVDPGAALRPGVYLIRLERGGQSFTSRAVVIR